MEAQSPLPFGFPAPSGHVCKHGKWHPEAKVLEFVYISNDLANRVTNHKNHVTLFANQTDLAVSSGQSSAPTVLLPFPVLDANSSVSQGATSTWTIIVGQLLKLKAICESGVFVTNMAQMMCDIVKEYCPGLYKYSNFDVLNDQNISEQVTKLLPGIIILALQLPMLLSKPIPVLKVGETRTIYATRKLLASLIANAFLCTFPHPGKAQKTPDFNFLTLFHTDPKYPSSVYVKREKLRCILNYFEKMSKDISGHHQVVSYERRFIPQRADWITSKRTMNAVTVDSQNKIENCNGMLQIDFANRVIGGGIYKEGCFGEDIRFCISPELLVARLFTQDLDHDEVLVVTGSEIFSKYSGYNTTFRFEGPANLNFSQATDTLGRTYTQLVAMDAQYFRADNKQQQFEQTYLDRELHKCYVAFVHGSNFISPVATGNWGCGQFNGDKELKFLIQWMAASHQDRPKIQFHTMGDTTFAKTVEDITDYLRKKNVEVGELYRLCNRFYANYKKHGKGGIFKYVKSKV